LLKITDEFDITVNDFLSVVGEKFLKVFQWLPKEWHQKVSDFCQMKFVHVMYILQQIEWINFRTNIRKETCFFLFLYDLIIKIVKNHGRSGKLWTIKRILSTYNVCDLVSSTVFSLRCWGNVFQWLPKDWHKKVSDFCKMKFVHVHFAADWMNKFPNRGRYLTVLPN
jgi:hypothetical protein